MSKKSRRRARHARERLLTPREWSQGVTTLAEATRTLAAALPAAFGHVADTFDRFNLSLTSIHAPKSEVLT